MKSPEKVLAFLEELQAFSDQDIADAVPVPVPPAVLRLGLAGIAPQIPNDHQELDHLLTRMGEFCFSLRSDEAIAAA